MMKNVDLNVKSLLITEDLVKDLFGIPAIRNVNVINHVMLENIQFMKTISVETNQLIKWLENVVKI